MPKHKLFSAEVRRFGEPAIIITTAYFNPGGYPRAEAFVLIPDNAKTLIANRLSFDVKSFAESPVQLNEELMLSEALGQARIDLLLYLQKNVEEATSLPLGAPMILDTNVNALVGAQFRGTLPQLADVRSKTELQELQELLGLLLKLPKIDKKAL